MEDIKTLYSRIENPIDNREKWNKLLDSYSISKNYEEFYNNIINKEVSSNIYYDREDKNEFILIMWSNFKHKILSYSLDTLKKEIENNTFDLSIYDAVEKISELESIKTYDSLLKVLEDSIINEYFSRMYLNIDKNVVIYSDVNINKKVNFSCVLSVVVNSNDLYEVLKNYINKCINNEMDYYIKYNETGEYITLNIYSSIENLKKNESILDVLKKENYTYFKNNTEDNLLFGNVNEYISIRSNSGIEKDNYMEERMNVLFRSFDSVIYNYVNNHLNIIVSYKGGRMNLIDYLATYIMEKVVDNLLSSNIRTNTEYFYIANSSDLLNLKEYIKSKLSFSMKDILKDRIYLKDAKSKVTLKLNNNKNMDIENSIIMCAIRNLTHTLISKDNTIEKAMRIRIKNECQFCGIDHNKLCLDSDVSKKIFYDSKKLDTYKNELDLIHNDIEKLNYLDNMLNEPNDDLEKREEISKTMKELLEVFE